MKNADNPTAFLLNVSYSKLLNLTKDSLLNQIFDENGKRWTPESAEDRALDMVSNLLAHLKRA